MYVLTRAVELGDQTENDDAGDPEQPEKYGDAVEVAFCDTGCPEVRGDAATEHVGETATTPTVQQDEQGQEETGDAEHHLQNDLEN